MVDRWVFDMLHVTYSVDLLVIARHKDDDTSGAVVGKRKGE